MEDGLREFHEFSCLIREIRVIRWHSCFFKIDKLV